MYGNPQRLSLLVYLHTQLHTYLLTIISKGWAYSFIGLAYQGKDIVFRFIIECSTLMDFGP
jgi:hypothetical protein